ncbi:N-acetylglucosamine-6-phosphate deacetylase [Gimibacter soli]|uniref:N-acetylglucosamine-6-phosphate deacetylase n=1 Tax=Gimibacter soli TaxID=3024400 RepID=A0AAF0BM36_9PROT|nr:N-acetylglucosamine-6-phosphate deacetylase [Gimibacter soli]WCL54075.1 N-acetylglucosamine-6-phosphate deacetylase [Gimibacter soli]
MPEESTLITGARILHAGHFRDGLAVRLSGGRISDIGPADMLDTHDDTNVIEAEGLTLVPGYIDVQVNGGGGVLFNDAPTRAGVEAIMAAHRTYGTTGMLPTLISDDFAVMRQAIKAVDEAIEAGVPGILGIHLEGPFLSEPKKGAHDAKHFRPIDAEAFEILTSLKRGVTHVTLAPEETSPETIAALTKAGVIISFGHTNATYEQAVAGIKAGATGVTHLYNAMTATTSRAPGVVGAVFEDNDVFAGIIVDGFHLHPASIRVAMKAMGADRLMLVTDAMPSVGMPEVDGRKEFTLTGRTVHVVNGRCTYADGTLAGSDLDMAAAVRNAIRDVGVSPEVAVAMATHNPAKFLRLDRTHGQIAPGYVADFVLVDDQWRTVKTIIGGEVY